jgi:hypothetical protein
MIAWFIVLLQTLYTYETDGIQAGYEHDKELIIREKYKVMILLVRYFCYSPSQTKTGKNINMDLFEVSASKMQTRLVTAKLNLFYFDTLSFTLVSYTVL